LRSLTRSWGLKKAAEEGSWKFSIEATASSVAASTGRGRGAAAAGARGIGGAAGVAAITEAVAFSATASRR